MSISSLGVGSGLALDDLVRQLISSERQPKELRLDAREKAVDAEISALGSIKSKISEFQDAVDKLRDGSNLNSREPTITNPPKMTMSYQLTRPTQHCEALTKLLFSN